MSRQEEIFRDLRLNCFSYTEIEWAPICQALRPYTGEDELPRGWRWILERAASSYATGVDSLADWKRAKAAAERLNHFVCQLDAVIGTIEEIPYGPSGEIDENGDEVEDARLVYEREGHLDWLRKVAGYARANAETAHRISTHIPPRRNSRAIDMYWRNALKMYARLGLKVDQSRQVIDFLVACAMPFAGKSVATPLAARRFLRQFRTGSNSSVAD